MLDRLQPSNPCMASLFSRRPRHSALHSFPTRRSSDLRDRWRQHATRMRLDAVTMAAPAPRATSDPEAALIARSEEHTSELQSRPHLVCRLLLEKKKRWSTNVCTSSRYMALCDDYDTTC